MIVLLGMVQKIIIWKSPLGAQDLPCVGANFQASSRYMFFYSEQENGRTVRLCPLL